MSFGIDNCYTFAMTAAGLAASSYIDRVALGGYGQTKELAHLTAFIEIVVREPKEVRHDFAIIWSKRIEPISYLVDLGPGNCIYRFSTIRRLPMARMWMDFAFSDRIGVTERNLERRCDRRGCQG